MRSTPRPETITVSSVTGTVPPNGPHNQPHPTDPSWQQPAFYLNQIAPPPPPPKRWPSWKIAVLVLALCSPVLILAVIAAAVESGPEPASRETGIGTPAPYDADEPPPAPQTSAPKSTAPAGPLTSFGDGIWQVGTLPSQIKPGTYRATVPDDSWGCYWERAKGTSGEFQDIIANGLGERGAPVIVTIVSSDMAFRSEDCGTWSAA